MRMCGWISDGCSSDLLVGQQEQQVDVRLRGELAAPVAADRDERQSLSRRGVGQRVEPLVGVVVDDANHLVDEVGLGAHGLGAAGGLVLEAAPALGTEFGSASGRERVCPYVESS